MNIKTILVMAGVAVAVAVAFDQYKARKQNG